MNIKEYALVVPEYYRKEVEELNYIILERFDWIFRTDYETYKAWSDFSETLCASWLFYSEDNLKLFEEFLEDG